MKIRDVMTPAPVTVASTDMVLSAAKAMKEQGVGVLPVITDGLLTGILTTTFINVYRKRKREPQQALGGDLQEWQMSADRLAPPVPSAETEALDHTTDSDLLRALRGE
jgi:CBS-domain-containing membrane protein